MISKSYKFQVPYSLWNDSNSSEKGKTVLGTTHKFSNSPNLTQRSSENWLEDQTVFCKKFPSTFTLLQIFFSWGDINRIYSQRSDLDAKEFCKLSLFYYLTWWWTELKSTMTKENTSLCITPGKEQGMNCQADSLNASSLVILNLLPGPETDLLTLAHLTGSWDCRKVLQLLLFLYLVWRGSQFKVNQLLYIQNHSQSRKNKPP